MFSLQHLNTFGISAFAKKILTITSETQLLDFLTDNQEVVFILGGGSNILLTQNINAVILHNQIKGIEIIEQDEDFVIIKANGGEVWHEFVLWAIERNFGGIENMSLIPGTVGAAPIQNIGAYGVELKDVFVSLEAIDLQDFTIKIFNLAECNFAYRDSFFKREGKGRFFITSVVFRLSCKPKLNTNYGDIQRILLDKKIENPTVKDVSNAVIHIRQSKLPDPSKLGNAGSFFKNPEIDYAGFERFIAENPTAPHYKLDNGQVKIPAGWLIEQAGWKGKRISDAGCHEKQALVLVNYGNATGNEILALAKLIQEDVKVKFGILISPEVNVI